MASKLLGQRVLWSASNAEKHDISFFLDTALLPAYVAAISFVVLLLHSITGPKTPTIISSRPSVVSAPAHGTAKSHWQSYVTNAGGLSIVVHKFLRMDSMFALLGLLTYSAIRDGMTLPRVIYLLIAIYASLLSCWNVLAPAPAARMISRHLSVVTFAIFTSYAYRDVWPLMTFTLRPADEAEGVLLWAKVALSAFAGLVEPVFEPYPFMPLNPNDTLLKPNPEQTASIASFLFYMFLDPIIWLAYRSTHLSFDQLPPQCDYDRIKHLVSTSYPYLDPFSGAKKENLLWSIIKAFRTSFFYQFIVLFFVACSRLASPIGTNRLLNYLETYGEGALVKPWVWILWIGAGPILGAIGQQLYIFLSLHGFVQVEGVITSLVFDHALRIRLKAEVSQAQNATQSREDVGSLPIDGSSLPATSGHSQSSTTASTTTAVSVATPSIASTIAAPAKKSGEPKAQGSKNGQVDTTTKKGPKAKGSNLVGKINNLVTSDLSNIQTGRNFPIIFVLAPVQIILSMWFLFVVLGWSSIVGLVVMIALFPVPTWVARRMSGVQKQKMRASDARVQKVTEVMNALRMVKLFGWESRVMSQLSEKRDEELMYIWRRKVLGLGNSICNQVVPLLHMIVTYATFTLIMKRELTASIVFSSMTAFNMLRGEMWRSFTLLPNIIQGYVALGRLSDFLRNTELLDEYDREKSTPHILQDNSAAHEDDIGCGKAHFTWSSENFNGEETPFRSVYRLRVEDDLIFKKGSFNLILGPTGSGKTSVLMALLGEMHYIPLGPNSWVNLPRKGGVAYAAQESWVQNDTIKENILFGAVYDEERYKKVIYQCGLKRDIALFEAGDNTEIGEKGITLSGGQKARVTLARAIYSSASILLLDDVLAALDVHTAKWIINKCFKGDLVKGRTVMLVTHNIAMATPLADFMISLGADGRIATQGSASDILAKNSALAEELQQQETFELEEDEDEEGIKDAAIDKKVSEGKLVVAEEIQLGHVSRRSFLLFIGNLGGKWPALFWTQYLSGLGLSEICEALELWWLGWWARQYTIRAPGEVSIPYYLGIYAGIVAAVITTEVYYYVIYTYGTIRASRIVHDKLVLSLLGGTFRWLDVTPVSRIITRCTQDIQAVDGPIPQLLNSLASVTLSMIARLAAVIFYTPTFLPPAIFIAALGGWLGQVYMKSQLSVKREMSNAKSPVLSVFSGAVAGLVSIRAYGAQEAFRQEMMRRIDRYIRAARSFWNLNRWIAIRIDALSAAFSASLAFYLVYGTASPDPSIIGFVLAMAVSFSDMILYWVRIYNEWEVNGNSLERIQQYIDIEQEPKPKEGGTPPAYWPSSGELRVEGLSARYSPDGPAILQDISFHVKAGERVGIVGRTGSGKSSLTLALLRCIYTEGAVYYDGIPTHTINLDALRSNVTIIPQVPELMTGTLRQNLDIFGEHTDATLNDALRSAGLFTLQRLSDENRITLDTPIASGGANLSVGQRQIIALARAIVRQSKLLVLDEATSAIDYETDAVIQESLRNELTSDVTVLTVAHRLQTIIDSDKIMVLDAGRLVEFDSPKTLLQNEKSFLRALVDESADKEVLYAMAEGKADLSLSQ